MTKLVDYRNRKLSIGERVRVENDIPSVDGMLHKNSIVKIDEHNSTENTIRVTDKLGKIWWVKPTDVSVGFL